MNLQEFLEEYNCEFVEVAGSANAKNQCVDLANAYLRDVCNHPIVEWTNACDFPSKISDMEWVVNDEESDVPIEGDIVIWSSKVGGGAGHIAIFIEGSTSTFKSFDQNWPIYSPCHIQTHTYSNVLGWLRPKLIINSEPIMTAEETRILEFVRLNKITEGQVRQGYGYITDNVDKKVADMELALEKLRASVDQLSVDLEAEKKLRLNCQTRLDSANAELDEIKMQTLEAVPTGHLIKELFNRLINLK